MQLISLCDTATNRNSLAFNSCLIMEIESFLSIQYLPQKEGGEFNPTDYRRDDIQFLLLTSGLLIYPVQGLAFQLLCKSSLRERRNWVD